MMAAGQLEAAEAKARQAQRMNVVPALTADRAEAVLHDLADMVNDLDGRFLTGPDVGTTPADMEYLHTLTPYSAGFREGGTAEGTAIGVHACMRAGARHVPGVENSAE